MHCAGGSFREVINEARNREICPGVRYRHRSGHARVGSGFGRRGRRGRRHHRHRSAAGRTAAGRADLDHGAEPGSAEQAQYRQRFGPRSICAFAGFEPAVRTGKGELRDPWLHPGRQDFAIGGGLFRRCRRAALVRRHHCGQWSRRRLVHGSAECAGAQGAARHAVRPQFDRRQHPAGSGKAQGQTGRLHRRFAWQLRSAPRAGRAQCAAGLFRACARCGRLEQARRISGQSLGRRARSSGQYQLCRRAPQHCRRSFARHRKLHHRQLQQVRHQRRNADIVRLQSRPWSSRASRALPTICMRPGRPRHCARLWPLGCRKPQPELRANW